MTPKPVDTPVPLTPKLATEELMVALSAFFVDMADDRELMQHPIVVQFVQNVETALSRKD